MRLSTFFVAAYVTIFLHNIPKKVLILKNISLSLVREIAQPYIFYIFIQKKIFKHKSALFPYFWSLFYSYETKWGREGTPGAVCFQGRHVKTFSSPNMF